MWNYTFYIYHVVCQGRTFCIDTLTKPHDRSGFCGTAELFVFTAVFHFTCGYEASLLL